MEQTAFETTALLRELAARFPIPEGRWHPFTDRMRACRRDFELSIAAVESDPGAMEVLEATLECDVLVAPDAPDAAVAEAIARLDELPTPEGQHPFLAEILPTLEAMRATLYAVAASPGATRLFRGSGDS